MVKHKEADKPPVQREFEIEYTALREEILKRIELRQQMLQIALAFAGVLFGFGILHPGVALVYPPLATLMAVAWAQNDHRVRDLAGYIRQGIEPHFAAEGWETHLEEQRKAEEDTTWQRTVLSHGGIFLWTQLVALGIGLAGFSNSPVEWMLLPIALGSVWAVGQVMKNARK